MEYILALLSVSSHFPNQARLFSFTDVLILRLQGIIHYVALVMCVSDIWLLSPRIF